MGVPDGLTSDVSDLLRILGGLWMRDTRKILSGGTHVKKNDELRYAHYAIFSDQAALPGVWPGGAPQILRSMSRRN